MKRVIAPITQKLKLTLSHINKKNVEPALLLVPRTKGSRMPDKSKRATLKAPREMYINTMFPHVLMTYEQTMV